MFCNFNEWNLLRTKNDDEVFLQEVLEPDHQQSFWFSLLQWDLCRNGIKTSYLSLYWRLQCMQEKLWDKLVTVERGLLCHLHHQTMWFAVIHLLGCRLSAHHPHNYTLYFILLNSHQPNIKAMIIQVIQINVCSVTWVYDATIFTTIWRTFNYQ